MKTSAQPAGQQSTSAPAISYKPAAAVSNEADHEHAGGQGDFDRRKNEQDTQSASATPEISASGAGDAGDSGGANGASGPAGSGGSSGGSGGGVGNGNASGDSGPGSRGPQFGLGGFSLAGPAIQAKLRVSQSDDPHEREADQVADAVVSGGGSGFGNAVGSRTAPPSITPRTGAGQVLRHSVNNGAGASGKAGGEIGGASESRIRGLSGGSPLPDSQRNFYESQMGQDFGGVRIHDGGQAQAATQSIGARALTHGNDIAFAPGEYQPESIEGRRLLAHELTHVVQQSGPGSAGNALGGVSRKADGDVVQRMPLDGDAADAGGGDADGDAISPDQEEVIQQLVRILRENPEDQERLEVPLAAINPEMRDGILAKARERANSAGDKKTEQSSADAGKTAEPSNVPVASSPQVVPVPSNGTTPGNPASETETVTAVDTQAPVAGPDKTSTARAQQVSDQTGTPGVPAAKQKATDITADGKDTVDDPETKADATAAAVGLASAPPPAGDSGTDAGDDGVTGDRTSGTAAGPDSAGAAPPAIAAGNTGGQAPAAPAGGVGSGNPGAPGAGAGGSQPAAASAVDQEAPKADIGGSPGQILDQLSGVPATQAVDALNQATGASGAALKSQRDQEQGDIPKIVPSTGMPAGEQPVKPKLDLKPAAVPDQFRGQKAGRGKAPINTNTVIPKTKNVNTKLKTDIRIDRGGDADPRQLDSAKAHSDQIARTQSREAQEKTFLDFGESKIQPAPREPDPCEAKPLKESTPGAISGAQQDPVPAAIRGPLDQNLTPALNSQIGQKSQEYKVEEKKFREQKGAARTDSATKIAAAKKEQTEKQLAIGAQAQKETEKSKAGWRSENETVQKDYDDKVSKASQEQKGKIRSEQSKGESKALEHVRKAEKDAADKKRSADEEADAKSKEPKKQGVFGWLADRAKAFIDGIKKAINAIYDGLRSAVKFIFDAAKQLIKGVLEAARFVIVSLIKAYALLLKGYLRVLGVFFPKICAKYTALIDQAVQFAVKAVNAVVDFLKTVYCGILDFLAETIDALLGLIQDIYNGLLTLIALIITGKFAEIIKGLANLYAAAKKSPSFFQQALMEELLGGNLSDPLSPAEVAWAYENKVPGLPPKDGGAQADQSGGGSTAEQGGPDIEGDAEGGPKPPYTNKNVVAEPVFQNETLHPDLMQEVIQRLGGGDGSFEFGQSDEPSRSIDSILQENRGQQNSAANAPAPANDQAKQPEDGLSPVMRGKIRWEMMKDSLAQWWGKNWPWILAAAVGVLAVGVAAIILSGGAILGIIPPLMAALTPIFVGMTIATIAKPLTNFVKLAWGGEIDGGAHQLAKAGAAGTIEAVTWLTFKTGTLAVRATKASVKGAIRAARTTLRLTKLASRSSRAFVRGAKVVMRGLQKSALRGVRRLRVLGRLLARRLRFRKFRIRIEGRRFKIEGFINPWVLLVDGQVKEVERRAPGAKFVSQAELPIIRNSFQRVVKKSGLSPASQRNLDDFIDNFRSSGKQIDEFVKIEARRLKAIRRRLKGRGLDDQQVKSFFDGEYVVYQSASVGGQPIIEVIQLRGKRLFSAIQSIVNEDNIIGATQDFLRFRGRSRKLARTMELQELELAGISTHNDKIIEKFKRLGFTPSIMEVPPALGGGVTEVFVRLFRL